MSVCVYESVICLLLSMCVFVCVCVCVCVSLSYPSGGGEHVLVPELEAVHLLQDDPPVLLALEEVCAAEDGGGPLGLVPLDQDRGGGVVRLHAPRGGRRRERRCKTKGVEDRVVGEVE